MKWYTISEILNDVRTSGTHPALTVKESPDEALSMVYAKDDHALRVTIEGYTGGSLSVADADEIAEGSTHLFLSPDERAAIATIPETSDDLIEGTIHLFLTPTEHSYLSGLTENIQDQIDALEAGLDWKGVVADLTALASIVGQVENDVWIIESDSEHDGGKTFYKWSGTEWIYLGSFSVNDATTSEAGVVRFAESGENASYAAVQGNDSRLHLKLHSFNSSADHDSLSSDVFYAGNFIAVGTDFFLSDAGFNETDFALKSISISASTGLLGGGDLSQDRQLAIAFGTASTEVARGDHSHTAFSLYDHTHNSDEVTEGSVHLFLTGDERGLIAAFSDNDYLSADATDFIAASDTRIHSRQHSLSSASDHIGFSTESFTAGHVLAVASDMMFSDAGFFASSVSFSGHTHAALAIAVDDLSDVVLTTPNVDDRLVFNGTGWVNRQPANTSASAGVYFYLDDSASDISTYHILSRVPIGTPEATDSVVVNNNQVLIESYASISGGLGGSQIDGGEWMFSIYAYVSSSTAVSEIIIEIYKRTAAGVETKLFEVTTGEINALVTPTLHTIRTIQTAYAINATDRLVAKFYGKTTRTSNTTIYFTHNGTERYTYFRTPLVTRHNDLIGLQGGQANDYYHLTNAQYTDVLYASNASGLYTPLTRTITAGTALTGGGDLSANRTLNVSLGTGATDAAAGNHSHTVFASTAHTLTHIQSGSDEIDGDKLDIDWNPINYTPATVTEADNVDHLSAHLKGIDTKFVSFASTAHTLTHIKGGNDEIDGDKLDIDLSPANYTPETVVTTAPDAAHLSAHLKGIDSAILAHTHDYMASDATSIMTSGVGMFRYIAYQNTSGGL